MALKIISGAGRGIMLDTPPDRSMRPTSGRSREALFSSLGDLTGKRFADIFAGSGAMALEALSRGAGSAVMLEGNLRHIPFIERNIAKLRKAGVTADVEVLRRKFSVGAIRSVGYCDVWFFDPPYAESADFLRKLLEDESTTALWKGALLIWELPDTAEARALFQQIDKLYELFDCRIKNLGGCDFLFFQLKAE